MERCYKCRPMPQMPNGACPPNSTDPERVCRCTGASRHHPEDVRPFISPSTHLAYCTGSPSPLMLHPPGRDACCSFPVSLRQGHPCVRRHDLVLRSTRPKHVPTRPLRTDHEPESARRHTTCEPRTSTPWVTLVRNEPWREALLRYQPFYRQRILLMRGGGLLKALPPGPMAARAMVSPCQTC